MTSAQRPDQRSGAVVRGSVSYTSGVQSEDGLRDASQAELRPELIWAPHPVNPDSLQQGHDRLSPKCLLGAGGR